MEDRPRAGHTRGIAQPRAIEVAHPHADGHVTRVPDRPVVVIRLRGARLHRDREWKIEIASASKRILACLGVAEYVGNEERRTLRHDRAIFRLKAEATNVSDIRR